MTDRPLQDALNEAGLLINDGYFTVEPPATENLDMLCGYKPSGTEELAEWLMIAGRNIVDADGLRTLYKLPPYVAWQIARMMQIADLKVPQ